MENIIRRSPVSFGSKPAKTEVRDHWTIVNEYEDEGSGPYLIDLSHHARWDLQDSEIASIQPWGIKVPDSPGQCVYENGIIVNRMNRTQASVWQLAGETPTVPDSVAFTDVTDATAFLALRGINTFSITEKLSSLDFLDPSKKTPFLLQGPFSHVPCQIVTLDNSSQNSGILFTFSRGYAQSMIAAILEAGEEFELHPAGENAFVSWVSEILS